MAEAKEWIMTRITLTTWLRLRAAGERMARAQEAGQSQQVERSDRHGITLDAVIAELLRRDEEHATRAAKSRKRRTKLDQLCDTTQCVVMACGVIHGTECHCDQAS